MRSSTNLESKLNENKNGADTLINPTILTEFKSAGDGGESAMKTPVTKKIIKGLLTRIKPVQNSSTEISERQQDFSKILYSKTN